ncbi:MAG TPA: ATP-binding cassette domain-containing protein [Bdellovibrionota bacterium]|jgi:phospholipid/cholesterol/gamma-HCH transport system ATP-binding protein|nr:ATP-binding cassette domain-containing protein [Bdellovibrionota bacterium]
MSAKKTPIIEVQGFSKSFGSKRVHQDLDFVLYSREVVSLIGGSGTGKSVFLRSLIGLNHPDSGRIFFKGRDVTNLSESEWCEVRKSIAYAFQGGALFDSLTVEENLRYPLDAHTQFSSSEKQKKIDAILDVLGMSGTQHLLPSDLSGGMQKRAGLARAIILEPEVILYDEPTAGLDPFNTKNIQDIINELKHKGQGGILVTHDMPTAMATSERISLLLDGRIAVSGPVADLDNNPLVKAFVTGEEMHGKA